MIRKTSTVLFIFLFLGIISFALSFTNTSKATTDWIYPQHKFRNLIEVTGVNTDSTDLEVKLPNINTKNLYDTGKLNADCSDIRFTDMQGNTLNYWVEEDGQICSTNNNTNFWIKFKLLSKKNNQIYMYYGNSSAVKFSSPTNTFDYFDNFQTQVENVITLGWYDSNFLYRTKLTIPKEKIAGALTDFPVYFDLDLMPDHFFLNVKTSGTDVLILNSANTTILDREVAFLDSNLKKGELWFKAPSLSNIQDNVFYLYYGNTGANIANSTSVWSSNYEFVQHLSADPSSGTFTDSASNAYNANINSLSSLDKTTGKVGNAYKFDGVEDFVEMGDILDAEIAGYGKKFTVSGWFKLDPLSGSSNFLFGKLSDSSFGENHRQLAVTVYDDKIAISLYLTNFVSPSAFYQDTFVLPKDEWLHIYFSYDQTDLSNVHGIKLFINNVQSTLVLDSWGSPHLVDNITDSASRFSIGAAVSTGGNNSAYHANSTFDEFTFTSDIKTDEWRNTVYENQLNSSGFVSVANYENAFETSTQLLKANKFGYGVEEISDVINLQNWFYPDYKYRFQVDLPASNFNTNLSNFPILLDLSDIGDNFFQNLGAFPTELLITSASSPTRLSREISTYNNVSGTLEVWFKAVSLSNTSANTFYVYFGKDTQIANDTDVFAQNSAGLSANISNPKSFSILSNFHAFPKNEIFWGESNFSNIDPQNTLNLKASEISGDFAFSKKFSKNSKIVARFKQTNNNLNAGFIGLTSEIQSGTTAEDMLGLVLDSSNSFSFRTKARGSSNHLNSTIAENSNFNILEIDYLNSNSKFRINSENFVSVNSNLPNIDLFLFLQNSDTTNELILDWIGISNNASSDNFVFSFDAEEKNTYPILYFDFNEENTQSQINKGSITSALATLGESTANTNYDPAKIFTGGINNTNYFHFDGANKFIQIDENFYNTSPTNFSTSFWFKKDSENTASSTHGIKNIMLSNTSFNNSALDNLEVGSDGTNLQVYIRTNTENSGNFPTFSVNAGLELGKWYYLNLIYDAPNTRFKIFLDAKNILDEPINGDFLNTSTATLTLGNSGADNILSTDEVEIIGNIDEFKIWDYSLTNSQAKEDFLANSSIGKDILNTQSTDLHTWYKFDESTGQIVSDNSANAFQANTINTTDENWIGGKFANSLYLNGVNQYVDSDLTFPVNNFTVSNWIKLNSSSPSNQTIWHIGDTDSLGLFIDNLGNLSLKIQNTIYPTQDTVSADKWYNIILTRNQNTYTLYKNGTQILKVDDLSILNFGTCKFLLGVSGCNTLNSYGNISIDQLLIFNTNLDTSQIKFLANTSLDTKSTNYFSGLTSKITFDQSGGSRAFATVGNDGILYGNFDVTKWVDEKYSNFNTKVVKFDGANYVDLDDNINPNKSTISFWYKDDGVNTNANGEVLVSKISSNLLDGFAIIKTTNQICIFKSPSLNCTTSLPEIENNWFHLTLTFDLNQNIKLFINSVQKLNITTSNTFTLTSDNLQIGKGKDVNYGYASGRFDEFYIWNEILEVENISKFFGGYNRSTEISVGVDELPVRALEIGFNQKTGTSIVTSNSLAGTTNATNPWVDDKYLGLHQNVFELDGVDDSIQINNVNLESINSYSLWFMLKKIDFSTTKNIVYFDSVKNSLKVTPAGGNNYSIVSGNNSSSCTSSSVFQVGEWYFLTKVFDGSTNSFFVNSNLECFGSDTATNSSNLTIGGDLVNFKLDNFRAFNKSLSKNEISKIYNSGAPVLELSFSNQTLNDSSQNLQIANSNNANPTYQSYNSDIGLELDGTKFLYFDHYSQANIDFENEFSICSFVNLVDNGSDMIWISKKLSGVGIEATFEKNSEFDFRISISDNFSNTAEKVFTNVINSGNLSHLCITNDGLKSVNSLKLYVNGVEKNASLSTTVAGTTSNTGQIYIASSQANTTNLIGLIDEFKIFNYKLERNDILKEKNYGASLKF